MIYRFDDFELDTARVELRRLGESVAIEPQVFALLSILVENHQRLIGKDELVEQVWQGRFISDSALSSCIKATRQVLGDDGKTQRLIRTVHGRGLRFVGDVQEATPKSDPAPTFLPEATPAANEASVLPAQSTRPSIAILPFGLIGVDERFSGLAHAIPHELIAGLSRQRWLMVIARCSSFQFHSDAVDLRAIGNKLGAAYCLTGHIELFGRDLTVTTELADTRDLRIVWCERFSGKLDELQEMRRQIIERIIGALEVHISLNEAQWARLTGTENLDAWAAFHLGLQHMYRFTAKDNEVAQNLFERSVQLDPYMARARAGLSFTHFQTAFMGRAAAREAEAAVARDHAEAAMALDGLDPFVNFNLGRAFWLVGDLQTGLGWLQRATELNPNYAQGHYARALNEIILGQPNNAESHSSLALRLSPLDPLRYGMLGVRTMTFMHRGDCEAAAQWGEQAAQSPGAHAFIGVIALAAHHMAGNPACAADWAKDARRRQPDIRQEQFFASFPFTDPNLSRTFVEAMNAHGIS